MELLKELTTWIEEQHEALAAEQMNAQESVLKRDGMLMAVDLVHQKIGSLLNGQDAENSEPSGPEGETGTTEESTD